METTKKYFYGNAISDYGLKNGYVDYRTFSKAFDVVLNNNIMQELENNGYYFEPYNYFVDNSEKIEEVENIIEELENELEELENAFYNNGFLEIDEKYARMQDIKSDLESYNETIEELEEEENINADIYQYYIVSDNAIALLEEAKEIYFYNSDLDIYIWAVTHYGTSWDYVLTDIKITW